MPSTLALATDGQGGVELSISASAPSAHGHAWVLRVHLLPGHTLYDFLLLYLLFWLASHQFGSCTHVLFLSNAAVSVTDVFFYAILKTISARRGYFVNWFKLSSTVYGRIKTRWF